MPAALNRMLERIRTDDHRTKVLHLAQHLAAGPANLREWWHHSRMTSRYTLLVSAAPLALAAFLVACSTQGNHRNGAADEALLQTLRQCLVDVSISETNKDFISPCIARDVSSLNGLSRHRLIDALGPPRLCLDQTEINFPQKEDCPSNQYPLWSFYRHAGSIDMGGGPQLVCVADTRARCVTVEWRRTK
jgi:hypothetical protein